MFNFPQMFIRDKVTNWQKKKKKQAIKNDKIKYVCFDFFDVQAQCLSVFQWSCYSVLLQLSVVIQHTQLSHTTVCSLLRVTRPQYCKTYIYIR